MDGLTGKETIELWGDNIVPLLDTLIKSNYAVDGKSVDILSAYSMPRYAVEALLMIGSYESGRALRDMIISRTRDDEREFWGAFTVPLLEMRAAKRENRLHVPDWIKALDQKDAWNAVDTWLVGDDSIAVMNCLLLVAILDKREFAPALVLLSEHEREDVRWIAASTLLRWGK